MDRLGRPTLGGLIITSNHSGPGGDDRLLTAMWLLLVALCSICFVALGSLFVWQEATYPGEAVLFAAIFFPGVLTPWASLVAFGRPIWRFLAAP